jgi:hypothetical protein
MVESQGRPMPNKHKQKKEKRQKGGNDGEASIGIVQVTYRPPMQLFLFQG